MSSAEAKSAELETTKNVAKEAAQGLSAKVGSRLFVRTHTPNQFP